MGGLCVDAVEVLLFALRKSNQNASPQKTHPSTTLRVQTALRTRMIEWLQ